MNEYEVLERLLMILLEEKKDGILFSTSTLDFPMDVIPLILKSKGIYEAKDENKEFYGLALEVAKRSPELRKAFIEKVMDSQNLLDKIAYIDSEVIELYKHDFTERIEDYIEKSKEIEGVTVILATNDNVSFDEIVKAYRLVIEDAYGDGIFIYDGIPFNVISAESFSDPNLVRQFVEKCFYDIDAFSEFYRLGYKNLT